MLRISRPSKAWYWLVPRNSNRLIASEEKIAAWGYEHVMAPGDGVADKSLGMSHTDAYARPIGF